MSILNRLFGRNRKDDNNTKYLIIKKLVKQRIINDPTSPITVSDIDNLPEKLLIGLPEATLFWIVENYWQYKNQGLADADILESIENHRASFGKAGILSEQLTLENYIKYRVRLEHQDGTPTDKLIKEGIREVTKEFT